MFSFKNVLFAAAVAASQISVANAEGCQASCDPAGELIIEGVNNMLLAASDGSISLADESETANTLLHKTAETFNVIFAAKEARVQGELNVKSQAAASKLNQTLYTDLQSRIIRLRRIVRDERDLLKNQIGCGEQAGVWSTILKKCIPATLQTCGALPVGKFPNRLKTAAGCSGIYGTECETHCAAGWQGHNITYVCTGTDDSEKKHGGWQRIKSHGNLNQECEDVNECAYPDYPCNDNTFRCTDTAGSFKCSCDSTMVESAEKVERWPDGALNGFGKTCECPHPSQWMLTDDNVDPPVPFCTCPFGGNAPMEVDPITFECACPAGALVEDCDATYPPAGEGGRLTTVLNQNDQNECQACVLIENCQDAWDYGLITEDEQYTYVRAPSSVTGRAKPTVQALCLRMTTDGGLYGETEPRVLTHIMCDDLEQYGDNCIESEWAGPAGSSNPSVDTCTQYGYIRQPFRSQEHYQKLYTAFGLDDWAMEWNGNYAGQYTGRATIEISMDFNEYFGGSTHGIYHQSSGKNVRGENMASTPGSNKNAADWQSVDDGPWWLHDFQANSDTSYTGYQNLGVGQDYYYFWYWSDNDTWGMLVPGGYSTYGYSLAQYGAHITAEYYPWSGSKYVCGHEHTNPSGMRRI